MDQNKIDELLTAAQASKDTTVKQALSKLLFVVSLAHDKEYIERANSYHFHSGCSITVPRSHEQVTMCLVWNDNTMCVRTRDYQHAEFTHGYLLQEGDPVPGIVLVEERNYKT